jgi:uncharacterized damage-inducible protein DinB
MQTLKDAMHYHVWAINTSFDSCQRLESEAFTRDLGNSFASVRDTLVHCLMADSAWYHRVRQLPFNKPNPADYPDLASLRAVWQPLLADWQVLIATTSPETRFDYQAFDGTPYNSSFGDIVRHVVNHGSYHRGQIAMMLRLLGSKAQGTDTITWSRL